MHFVYIIYSVKSDKYYIGETSCLEERLLQHNKGYFKNAYTKISSDWELKAAFKVDNCTSARTVERYLKSKKSRIYLEKLIAEEAFKINFKKDVLEKFGIDIKC
ncbi:MAG TPA: GIY-YIG nuclease family protein [Chitinophagales bacterium]|nr:GIY-YIG nuclease family protein [Chitinophagales bacterium]